MKKIIFLVLALCTAALAMPGMIQADSSATLDNEMGQSQGQDQGIVWNPVTNDNVSVGSLPNANPIIGSPQLLYIPSEQRSRQINDLQGGVIADVLQRVTMESFDTFKETSNRINGKKYFSRMEKHIKRMPTIIRTGNRNVDEVFILDELKAGHIKMRPGIEIHGIIGYDSELDKDLPLTRQQIYMFAGKDALELTNSNVIIPLFDSWRNQFRARSLGAALAGVFSQIFANSDPWGIGLGSGLGFAGGRHTMYGESGATVAFLYIEPGLLNELLADPIGKLEERMDLREMELAECTVPGRNNARLHTEQADDYVQLYKNVDKDSVQVKALNGARFHYERALKNGIADQEELKRVYAQLSKVYTELALQAETVVARNNHAKSAEKYGKLAGFVEAHRLAAIN